MAEKDYLKNYKPLKFGTSGLRDLVGNMTDMECYINTTGFIKFLIDRNEIDEANNKIALAGDYRGSTPGIMTAVARAIDDSGCSVINCGLVPTPVLVLFAMRKKIPSIMVTGSHIPDNRNGIKFTKKSGEVLKSDEQDILRNVALAREKIYSRLNNNSPFDPSSGMFKPGSQEPASLENTDESQPDHEEESIDLYLKRYTRVFTNSPLQNKKIVLYQHSAVGRDIVQKIFEALGAEVIAVNRSDKFIPVDTEKVSSDTRELLKQWAQQYKPFALISTDGDSDRPLLADETGQFLPGDKLGALVSLFLEPDFAAIPISANDAVVSALEAKGVKITQTKIGSPYVVAAMNDELDLNPQAKVVSWESNGGFLLGSDWQIDSETLKALPTRDAVLPLLTTILLAIRENKSVSELITEKLPSRYTQADVVDNTTPGCENYTADMGKTIINMFSPQNKNIFEIDFSGNTVTVKNMELTDEIRAELKVIKTNISSYFNKETGFSEVISINFTDGIRIVFDNKEVAHLRPSGNAPEFRMYATADTQDRANEIVAKRTEIIPAIVADLDQDSARVRIRQALKEGHPVYLSPYHDPRVWGVGGIGEYWYGAEVGQKSSMAIIEKDSAPLVDIFNKITEDILGKKAAPKLDNILPLVKILTPKSRLSVQFHDTKNELWIITGIDKTLAQGRAELIIGFSPTVIEKYKDKV
ncbi:MAG: hypothetical protein KAV18_07400, partial [Candidatus Omnitrophica bacterium]|nr:hypothetical protein [Candidatus Omnitrophota bacterium]